jgi:hypothetical protein
MEMAQKLLAWAMEKARVLREYGELMSEVDKLKMEKAMNAQIKRAFVEMRKNNR